MVPLSPFHIDMLRYLVSPSNTNTPSNRTMSSNTQFSVLKYQYIFFPFQLFTFLRLLSYLFFYQGSLRMKLILRAFYCNLFIFYEISSFICM